MEGKESYVIIEANGHGIKVAGLASDESTWEDAKDEMTAEDFPGGFLRIMMMLPSEVDALPEFDGF